MSKIKPEDQAAFYKKHPPICIADFLSQPDRVDIDFDGHGFVGIYPNGLTAKLNIVFSIQCKCGNSSHSIVAQSNREEIRFYKNLVIAEKYFLECNSCHTLHLFFDPAIHGYNAEVNQLEGLSFDDYIENTETSVKNEKIECECSNCKNTAFAIFTRFEYSPDLFDEPSFEGREPEFFSWFTGIGKCKSCSDINLFIDFECA